MTRQPSSHTADERDTRRAMRNARYLAEFSGIASRAVVTAARIDDRIAGTIESGEVGWHQLDERRFFDAE